MHRDLSYTLLRVSGEGTGSIPSSGIIIVCNNRIEALTEILGAVEPLATVKGKSFELLPTISFNLYAPGSDLVDIPYTPLFSSSRAPFRVISAPHVTSDTGTGLVHCAPAHGFEDYQALLSLGLVGAESIICHVDKAGRFTPDVADVVGSDVSAMLVGKDVLQEGSKAIVELLKNNGNLVKVQRFKHRYPYDWKTDEPIIVTCVFDLIQCSYHTN